MVEDLLSIENVYVFTLQYNVKLEYSSSRVRRNTYFT